MRAYVGWWCCLLVCAYTASPASAAVGIIVEPIPIPGPAVAVADYGKICSAILHASRMVSSPSAGIVQGPFASHAWSANNMLCVEMIDNCFYYLKQ